ncbi:MAG: malonyl-[acyl-carrier protein] O-methyltransferase BioC [Candidatus Electrothrix sp. AR3]|nr:malonyl-[acyl-carrier protein] O-methyltransferase BioC [Candidatus Electrothrix sp. AR3]
MTEQIFFDIQAGMLLITHPTIISDTSHKVDKKLVCRQFRRAAESYDDQAAVQYRTANRLLELLEQYGRGHYQRVLEIGCCTGLLTRKLISQDKGIKELVLNDLVPDFADRMAGTGHFPALTFLPGDIESVQLPGSFDLIISSSTFHWLHDLDSLLARLVERLNPGGILLFSLYGPDNLQEIKSLTGIGLDYCTFQQVQAMVRQYCTLDHSSQQRHVFDFATPQAVLTHLRQTGVNAVSGTPWTREDLRYFCREYTRRFQSSQHVQLTYHPLYFVAHK